ncbi:fluoride efflux transporter CrcB [Acinetobacter sp.]|jgi:CrcB protein|uniref:fluoride efflux transporter CrcB n=1 Tax=Acinetobacter sp. TaxID=472 RepID=UPI0028186974|nr:fluoride efflux transporter CrcB [Acinetobacter sp.]MDR0238020.1 fluoride efflux transporter CrcB [Acinetobacter sp.]
MYFSFFSIAIGSILGGWLRWAISLKLNQFFENIPLGTVVVNLLGAFIIGLAVSFFSNSSLSSNYKLLIVTGFCGGLTTFSTFSIEVVTLLQSGKFDYALFTIFIHVLGSLLFTYLGIVTYQIGISH